MNKFKTPALKPAVPFEDDDAVAARGTSHTGRFAALSLPMTDLEAIEQLLDADHRLSREQEYARMLKTLVGNIQGMVYRCRNDEAWTMDFVSDGCLPLTGYSVDDFTTSRKVAYERVIHPEDRDSVRHLVESASDCATPFDLEYRIVHADGSIHWVWERGIGVSGPGGQAIAYEGLIQDITARKEADHALRDAETERKLYQARIEQQANYDTLTGLANRSLLNDRVEQAILTCSNYKKKLAVAFIDLDRFKFINDSLGHHVGDELLKCMAQRIKTCVREVDTLARLGGDEFVLLLTDHEGSPPVRAVIERLLRTVAEPWSSVHGEFKVTCSIGVAMFPDDGTDAQSLLKHADSAMYRAKDNGRNNFQFFTREFNAQMTKRLELESKLRRAIERDQFVLHYQPRVDLGSGRCVGAEALIRWQISPQEMIMPGNFIPLAEETGLIVPIGTWVLETACAQNKAWQDAGLAPIGVSVNVSARQFWHDGLVRAISDALDKSGMDPKYLEIEITESLIMHGADHMLDMLHAIKKLGVQISVDDFGTGYSSLSYLKRFPVDRLKVDRSFVQDLLNDKDDATIAKAIVALGHNLGLRVVAEGVESVDQMHFLRQIDCDEAQGYYFSRPVARDSFPPLLAADWKR